MPNDSEGLVVAQIQLKVNGQDLFRDELMQSALITAEVDSTFEMPDMCTLSFHDHDLEILDSGTFAIGMALEVGFAGEGETPNAIFKGEITAIEPVFDTQAMPKIIVRGYDRSHRLNRGTKSQAYVNQTDADIVKKIAGDAGLSASTDATGGAREHVFQHNQTDLAFLHQLARLNGFEVYVDDKTLHFKKSRTKRGNVTLVFGNDLYSFTPRLSAAGQVDEVLVKGWNVKEKKAIIGKASSTKIQPQISSGGSGGAVAKSKFGGMTQIEVRRPVESQKHADSIAQAILDEIGAGFVEAEGVADGKVGLIAGAEIEIERLGKTFSGKYIVTSARHIFDEGQYVVEFTVSGARPRLMSDLLAGASVTATDVETWGGVYPAIVTNINDPDKSGRVKVKYPWLDDTLESGWARVAVIGGGKDRGFQWLPEVNDEVVIAFEQGDFNHPFVLAGLHNGKDNIPEKTAVKNGKVEIRTLKTREGHIIRLNDKNGEQKIEIIDAKSNTSIVMDTQNKKITITTKDKFVVNADGDVTVNAKGNADIQAQGNATLKASGNVNIEGMNVTIKANGALKLQGTTVSIQSSGMLDIKSSAIMNIQSSAIMNIKGTLLNLN